MTTAKDIIDEIISQGANNRQAILDALRDGEALKAMGVTDDGQEAVEEAFGIIQAGSDWIIALEDNAGGLHLATGVGGYCTHFFSGFEHGGSRAPKMQEEIESAATDGVRGWDGDAEDPQASYDYYLGSQYGYSLIGEWIDGEVIAYQERMGNAGRRWARIPAED